MKTKEKFTAEMECPLSSTIPLKIKDLSWFRAIASSAAATSKVLRSLP